MALGLHSQGTVIRRGDGASPEAFVAIGEVKSVGGPTGSAPVIDISHLTSAAREKRLGLADEGQVTLSCNLIPGDAAQVGLRADRLAATLRNFRIELPASPVPVLTFSAYVLEFSTTFAVDEPAELTITLEISGAVTWA